MPRPARARDPDLVDLLEHGGRVPGQDVNQSRREAAPDRDGCVGAARVEVERTQLLERVVLIVARRDGYPTRDRTGNDRMIDT